jgi:Nuclear transport factor 2 (NTF2) domain
MSIGINNVHEPIIHNYFEKLNIGDFGEAANLFAEQGCLNPPFEKSIQGRSAIAKYFESEAKGMKFCPEQGQKAADEGEQTHYQIQGKVETNWFTVNVNWSIKLNAIKEILVVEVNLLASMNDLFHLNTLRSPTA